MINNIINVILFITVGFVLFLIELLTPGFGLAGISGILLLVIGCYIAYTKISIFWGIIVSGISIIFIIYFFKFFSKSFIWKRIRLDTKERKDAGFVSTKDSSELLGKEGVSLTVLKPTGIANINGYRIDVIANNLFIDKGKKIQVIEVSGNKIIVKEIK